MKDKTDNILRFPIEKATISKRSALEDRLEDLCDELTVDVMTVLMDEGMDVEHESNVFYISFYFEALRSLVHCMNDIYHPMQDLADTMYADFDTNLLDVNYIPPEQLELDL